MDDHSTKNVFEPIETAPKEVQVIMSRVLALEKQNIFDRQGATLEDILRIIKEAVK